MLVHKFNNAADCLLAGIMLDGLRNLPIIGDTNHHTSTYINETLGLYYLQATDLTEDIRTACLANVGDDVAAKAAIIALDDCVIAGDCAEFVACADTWLTRCKGIPEAEEVDLATDFNIEQP